MNAFFDEQEIRKTIALLKPNGQLFEVRILDSRKKIQSGYFTDADTMINALNRANLREANVYITLGYVNQGCYSRIQHDTFRPGSGTTSDTDIDGYQWMLIDFDPVRPADVSSSHDELMTARAMAQRVYVYLQDMGFSEPVKALSGNGFHLLYRINLKNTEENRQLVHDCLTTLDELFSNDQVHVDTTNYNPSRICKLHGTLAQKGANTEERPHRMSRIFSEHEPAITGREYLEKLAAQTEHKKPSYRETTPGARFDLVTFMNRNGIGYREQTGRGRDNSTIYALDTCPFDGNHRNGDAKIFSYPDGRISFICHHNSCRGRSWQDVRLLYEPDAYSNDRTQYDEAIEEGWKQHNRLKVMQAVPPPAEEPEDMFRTASQIMDDDEPDHEFIRSGITEIDTQMHGLEKQCVSVVSGLRGSGKTTLIGNLILSAVQDEHTVVVYSGQLSNKKYLGWINRQAAGKNHVEISVKYKNGVGVARNLQKQINEWMGERFWLYNNRSGNAFARIAAALEKILTEKRADLCIIDNMMSLQLDPKKDKYDAQTDFVWQLKNIAQRTNTHIVFVAHPKKAAGYIRLDDISGAGNIGNIVDNAFMVHRNNEDFRKRLSEFSQSLYRSLDGTASNYIEIAKDREGGLQDYFIPLYYEDTSKRLKNAPDENIVYGWCSEQERMEAVTDADIPW